MIEDCSACGFDMGGTLRLRTSSSATLRAQCQRDIRPTQSAGLQWNSSQRGLVGERNKIVMSFCKKRNIIQNVKSQIVFTYPYHPASIFAFQDMQMTDFSQYQHFGTLSGADYYLIDADIIFIVPSKDFFDNANQARESAEFQNAYARKLGKKCATLVVMSNVLSQDAESRRVYGEQAASGLYYGAALVVDNALSRALGSFLIGMSQQAVPIRLFDSVEKGIDWLRSIRPA